MPAINRRELIQIAAAAALTAPLGLGSAPARFFTADEFAMLDELTEMIVPTDYHSPGARAAGVAAYIDARVAEAFEQRDKDSWRNGLRLVDALSSRMNGRPFLQATPAERLAVLTRMAENETHPKTPEERFFGELKHATAHAYYTSKIGIHQEMEYKGNTILEEFVGYEVK
jgi:glucoside 3-dehydrogenase (cytochrome c) hitch-hiker subunit